MLTSLEAQKLKGTCVLSSFPSYLVSIYNPLRPLGFCRLRLSGASGHLFFTFVLFFVLRFYGVYVFLLQRLIGCPCLSFVVSFCFGLCIDLIMGDDDNTFLDADFTSLDLGPKASILMTFVRIWAILSICLFYFIFFLKKKWSN